MKIFLDTSSLFKLYHKEADTHLIEQIFSGNKIDGVFLSEIAMVEFASTVWKKYRLKEIDKVHAQNMIGDFEADFGKYTFTHVSNAVIEHAKNLLSKYGAQGLRSLDSIQLSTSLSLVEECNLFVSSDKLLNIFFRQESLPVPDTLF